MSESERFSGIARLVGDSGLERLRAAHVCVVGIGGVGSWAVEALARSGIGELTLVDLDDVCISNINRQLHALDGEIGKPKVEVMARRVQAINPACKVHPMQQFFTAKSAEEILAPRYTYIFDAIDHILNKSLLISRAVAKGIPIITAGAAGGRRRPEFVRVADLTDVTNDRLLQLVRKELRKNFGFAKKRTAFFNVPAIYSSEPPVLTAGAAACEEHPSGSELRITCDTGYGTASFVTGAFAFVGVAFIVNEIVGSHPSPADGRLDQGAFAKAVIPK
jgi:tRNA A37 threonylcarbamoyladenosine dehydratase